MIRAARRMVETHSLLVVVLRDEELEDARRRARPGDADDVTRAVTAAALLNERQIVVTRLQHLGAHVIESRIMTGSASGWSRAYIDLKRRNLL